MPVWHFLAEDNAHNFRSLLTYRCRFLQRPCPSKSIWFRQRNNIAFYKKEAAMKKPRSKHLGLCLLLAIAFGVAFSIPALAQSGIQLPLPNPLAPPDIPWELIFMILIILGVL
jgi:hypothetical protein